MTEHTVTTRQGFCFYVRPACPDDEGIVAEFFRHVSREDLRFRFLSSVREVAPAHIATLTHPDHDSTESFLAFTADRSLMIATAMLACDANFQRGEVAIAIREDHKGQGIGWELLAHMTRLASEKGVHTLETIESRDNHDAIELERNMGFTAREYPEDATLVLLSRDLDRT